MTITEFIAARLDEDQQIALAASTAHDSVTLTGEHWRWECGDCDTVIDITPVTLLDELLTCPGATATRWRCAAPRRTRRPR